MKRWIRFGVVALLMLGMVVAAVACGSDPILDNEQVTDGASSTEKSTAEGTSGAETTGEETTNPPQEPADGPEAGPEPSQPDNTTGPEQQVGPEGAGPEATPTEPLPPWNKDEPAAPKAYSGGTCPTLKPGTNTMQSGGKSRSFDLYLPTLPGGAPVIFMWHGLGDNPQNFARSFGASQLSSSRTVIIVVPKGISGPEIPNDVSPQIVSLLKANAQAFFETWSFFGDPTADLTLFDDVLACLNDQYKINRKKVYTSGFSAGALWSTYLTMHRSEYLAASLILSGGTMQKVLDLSTIPFVGSKSKVKVIDIPYTTPSHKVPVMLTAGGSNDVVSMASFVSFDFQVATDAFSKSMVQDSHFVIQCDHTAGHTFPQEIYTPAIDFLFKHEFTNKGSPMAADPLPAGFPSYCRIASNP
ncbi:MAG: hypothetical protein EP343_23455 [Deltaproteobacteria bacterium]|nr:MAG: hypothetical protein EP343_23455 [Deltaproteobacteria bacterium]